MIFYYKFCCRIRITDNYDGEMPGGEFLAADDSEDIAVVRRRFSDARVNEVSDWYNETAALAAHVRALSTGRSADLRRRLVDTRSAILYTGRNRQVLYRWLKEGRLTGYWHNFGAGPVRAWDVLELPSSTFNGPPPVRTQANNPNPE